MEEWQLEFEWLRVRHYIKDKFGKADLPELNNILFLIGVQELGLLTGRAFTKEEKRDLMHVAVCELLSPDGFYAFEGRDQDGWPHYISLKPFKTKGVKEQENLLKEKVIEYFKPLINEITS